MEKYLSPYLGWYENSRPNDAPDYMGRSIQDPEDPLESDPAVLFRVKFVVNDLFGRHGRRSVGLHRAGWVSNCRNDFRVDRLKIAIKLNTFLCWTTWGNLGACVRVGVCVWCVYRWVRERAREIVWVRVRVKVKKRTRLSRKHLSKKRITCANRPLDQLGETSTNVRLSSISVSTKSILDDVTKELEILCNRCFIKIQERLIMTENALNAVITLSVTSHT